MEKNYLQKKQRVQTHYSNIINEIYTEEPVDIWTFISSPHFLGKITSNGNDVYPVWRNALEEMFNDNTKIIVILTGSIGTGKSTIALYALCYIQYKLMILKTPWKYFGLADSGKMSMSFFNLNKTLGDSRGYKKMQYYMSQSPWFQKHAIYRDKTGEMQEFQLIKYILSSPYAQGGGIVGEDVVSGILDEVDTPLAAAKQKERVIETYNSTIIRFKNRFVKNRFSIGKLFIVSSKQDELAFIDTLIAKYKDSSDVLIFDIPLWQAKPKHNFSGVTFPVAVGDAYNPPKIIKSEETEEAIKSGYRIINVPIEFKKDFQLDLIRALRDIAGVTVAGTRKFKLFPSEKFVIECFDETKIDPVKLPTINVGLKDEGDLLWYLDLNRIRLDKSIPRCIHFDISISGDSSSISMAGVKEWTYIDVQKPEGTFERKAAPVIETDFVMRIKARDGDRIPLHKLRKLVLDLRAAGFNIFRFSADLVLASEDTRQLLQAAGIETEYISVDRSNQPYYDFRDLVYQKRWVSHRRSRLLFELKHLEEIDGKIDHPKEVTEIEFLQDGGINEIAMEGSKDEADAVVGAVSQCLKYNIKPMNTQLIKDIITKTIDNNKEQEEDIVKNLNLRDSQGNEIMGTKEGNHIDKINDFFRRMHNR